MNNLLINETKSSPYISFDNKENILKIKGQSYPENAAKFYDPLFKWLDDFFADQLNDKIIVDINLIYLNTSSSKIMINFFNLLEDEYKKGKKITINWSCDKDNEIAFECGEEFKEDLTLPFNLIQYSENSNG